MTRLRLRRQFIRPWYVPTPGEDGDEMAFFFDGITYTAGTLTAGSGVRTIEIELTSGGNAITSGTGYAPLGIMSDANYNSSSYFIDGTTTPITASTCMYQPYSSDNLVYILIIPASDGHVKCTLTYGNESASPVSIYPIVLLPNGNIDASAEFVVPATTG